MIKLINITKQFKTKKVLNNINFEFPDQGLFIITGDNGAGKTTLLYIIGLLDFDFEGKYYYNDKEILLNNVEEIRNIRRKDIAYIFSKGNLIPYFTVSDYLGDGNNLISCLDYLPSNQLVNTLSGGEEILLALNDEFKKKKKVYLLDEVTSALDENHFNEVMKILKIISKTSLVILVAHDERVTKEYGKVFHIPSINDYSDLD